MRFFHLVVMFLVFCILTVNAQDRLVRWDRFKTIDGELLEVAVIGHASVMFKFRDKVVHVDPVLQQADYSTMPRADVILITHSHGDHFDTKAIEAIRKQDTQIVLTEACAVTIMGTVMKNGDVADVAGFSIRAVPAYNIVHKRSDGSPYHPKGVGNGYVIGFGDIQVYIAGDTENVPEMKELRNIDIAFLPMNLPYTMTLQMVADAVSMFKPKVLYVYHNDISKTAELLELLKDKEFIDLAIIGTTFVFDPTGFTKDSKWLEISIGDFTPVNHIGKRLSKWSQIKVMAKM